MQTPYGLVDPSNVGPLVNALRSEQPVRLAGDVVQLPVIPHGTAGVSDASSLEAQRNQLRPYFRGGSNVVGVPRETILNWLVSPSSQGKVYAPPVALPPQLGGPNMPRGGGGGFLPPKL